MRALRQLVDARATTELAAKDWLEDRIKQGEAGVFVERVLLTPELARELKARNHDNRPIRISKLRQYEADIKAGRWQVNGETIGVSKEGALNNGQHRCEAVINTHTPIWTLVAFGLERESRRTVDTGAGRSPGDALAVEGLHYTAALAGITRFVIAYERGKRERLAETNRITPTEVVERAMADEPLQKAAAFPYRSKRFKRFASPSVFGFCFYVLSQVDADGAETFLSQVVDGVALEVDMPAYRLRERLIEMERGQREAKIELILRAWNAFRAGETIRGLTVRGNLPPLL